MKVNKFNTIEEAIADIATGKMIVVVDDEDRENEGDLLMAAEKVTPEAINFMARHGRGLICMPIARERLDQLNILSMVEKNTDSHQTAFTVSIDAMETTTGMSAPPMAITIWIPKKSAMMVITINGIMPAEILWDCRNR